MTTPFITKAQFVSAIEALREQYHEDRKNADLIGMVFGADLDGKYNNSILSNAVLDLLRMFFPKDADGHCELEHYCYVCSFGKIGEAYEAPEEFYDRLVSEITPNVQITSVWANSTSPIGFTFTSKNKVCFKACGENERCECKLEREKLALQGKTLIRTYNPEKP